MKNAVYLIDNSNYIHIHIPPNPKSSWWNHRYPSYTEHPVPHISWLYKKYTHTPVISTNDTPHYIPMISPLYPTNLEIGENPHLSVNQPQKSITTPSNAKLLFHKFYSIAQSIYYYVFREMSSWCSFPTITGRVFACKTPVFRLRRLRPRPRLQKKNMDIWPLKIPING